MFIKFRARDSAIYLGGGPARNGVYWIDDAGDWQPASFLTGAADVFAVASRGLYFHLGAIRVGISDDHRSIHINWSVRNVDHYSLCEVLDYLEFFRRGYRVILEYYCDGWVRERFGSELKAIPAIIEAQKFRKKKVPDSVFIQGVDDLNNQSATTYIQKGLEQWHKGRGLLSSEQISGMLSKLLIYQFREKDGHLMALSSGPDAACQSVFQKGWAEDGGTRLYDYEYPSRHYCSRVTESYHQILEDREIGFDHIRATIPQQDGEQRWVSYQRLLLPLELPDGSRALGCLSEISPVNAIPVFGVG